MTKGQLHAISKYYAKKREEEWADLCRMWPEATAELNKKYKYTQVKMRKLKELYGIE